MSGGPRCAGCKRPLKRPSPTGYGPVCWRRKHRPPARRPRPTAPAPTVEPIPGQTELDLPGIDWSDVAAPERVRKPRRRTPQVSRPDLWACGLTSQQIRTMTTVPTGSYL